MKKLITIIPKVMWLPLIISLTFNVWTYNGTRLITDSRYHYNLTNRFDDKIVFVPWTFIIYMGCYIFWILNYILGCRQKQSNAFAFISADLFGKMITMIIFLAIPTTNVRPNIVGNGIWENAMIWLYKIDPANNLFPSIHCLTSWLCYIAVRENEKIPKWYKIMSIIFALSVCVSTLTTKQHVLIDVIAGVLIAEGSYRFVKKSGLSNRYEELILKLISKLQERRKVRE